MAKASNNDYPSILVTEQAAKPTAPASGKQRLYMKTDHKLYHEDSGGTETEVGGGGGISRTGSTTDGNLAVWDGNDTDALKDGGAPGGGSGNATESVAVGSETLTTEGDLNFATDGPVIERYDGAAWQTWGPVSKLTKPPATGSWTWVNQGTATLANTGGVLTLTSPAAAPSFTRALVMNAPATPYTITALVGLYVPKANWYGAGLMWRQSSDGKEVFFGYQNDSAPLFSSYKVAGAANAVAAVYSPVWNETYQVLLYSQTPFIWLRIQDEGATGGSNRICSFSYDGLYWITYHTVGRTDYMTADQVGFGTLTEANAFPVGMTVFSWAVT